MKFRAEILARAKSVSVSNRKLPAIPYLSSTYYVMSRARGTVKVGSKHTHPHPTFLFIAILRILWKSLQAIDSIARK